MMSAVIDVQTSAAEGPAELAEPTVPRWLRYVWVVLCVLAVLEGLHELTGLGSHAIFDSWLHVVVIAAAGGLCLLRARQELPGRAAWVAFGAALLAWAFGDVLWAALYDGDPDPPYPSVGDVFWLAWYPLVAFAIGALIRTRIGGFELHRWLDGLALVLIVIIPGFVFVLDPVAEQAHEGTLATVVDFSYPILDVVLLGALLGVYGVLAWRPGRMWLVLGLGLACITISDIVSAVQQERGEISGDFMVSWTVGALLVAYAAWLSHTHHEVDVFGWRAIALAVAAQALAAAIQIYGLFGEIGESERVVTLAILVIATTQIIMSRPRPPGDGDAGPD
jgi:hypothetical protein